MNKCECKFQAKIIFNGSVVEAFTSGVHNEHSPLHGTSKLPSNVREMLQRHMAVLTSKKFAKSRWDYILNLPSNLNVSTLDFESKRQCLDDSNLLKSLTDKQQGSDHPLH